MDFPASTWGEQLQEATEVYNGALDSRDTACASEDPGAMALAQVDATLAIAAATLAVGAWLANLHAAQGQA